ncbi:MAG: hypothetical protein WBH28_00845, partial [Fuerstiella sp.]
MSFSTWLDSARFAATSVFCVSNMSLRALAQCHSLCYIGSWNLGIVGFVFSFGLHELGGLLSSWVSFS